MISGSPHPDLNKAYRDIFSLNTNNRSHDKAYAIKALKCVLCSFRPLHIKELVQAIAMDPHGKLDESVKKEYVLDICSNFILLDNSDTVHLAHLSVREYLEQESFDDGHTREFSPSLAHAQMAESCLAFIVDDDIGRMTIESLKEDFLQYSVIFWADHCEKIPEERKRGNFLLSNDNPKLISWASLVQIIWKPSVASHYSHNSAKKTARCQSDPSSPFCHLHMGV